MARPMSDDPVPGPVVHRDLLVRDPSERSDRRIAQASLNAGDVGPIEARTVREALLRPALAFPKQPHSRTESAQQRIPPFGHAPAWAVLLALSIYYQ